VGRAVSPFPFVVGETLGISEKERVLRSLLRGPVPPAVCGRLDTDPVLLNMVTLRRERRGERARDDSLGVLGCDTRSSMSTDVAAAGGVFFSRLLADRCPSKRLGTVMKFRDAHPTR
jgi:hypothetical protein